MKKFTKLLLVSTLVIASLCLCTACNRSDKNDNNNVESSDMANGVDQTPTPTHSPEPTMTAVPTHTPEATTVPEGTHNNGVVDDVVDGAGDVVDGVVDGVEDVMDGVRNGVTDVAEPTDQPR